MFYNKHDKVIHKSKTSYKVYNKGIHNTEYTDAWIQNLCLHLCDDFKFLDAEKFLEDLEKKKKKLR